MNKHLSDEEIIALIEGASDEKATRHLAECQTCQKNKAELEQLLKIMASNELAEAPESLKWGIQSAIAGEKEIQSTRKVWIRVAAAVALLIVGFLGGKWSSNLENQQLQALESDVALLKQVTFSQQMQSTSASQRISAVSQFEKSEVDEDFVLTLVKILNTDASPNVRYAASQSLAQFIDRSLVRTELVKSLRLQTDPFLQITLMYILTEANEKSAIAPVKDILNQEEINPDVKRQAEIALQILI